QLLRRTGGLVEERRALEDEVVAGPRRGGGSGGSFGVPRAGRLGRNVDGQGGGEVLVLGGVLGGASGFERFLVVVDAGPELTRRRRGSGIEGVEIGGDHVAAAGGRTRQGRQPPQAAANGLPGGHRRPLEAPPHLVERQSQEDQAADEGQRAEEEPGAPGAGQRPQRMPDGGTDDPAGPPPATEPVAD